MTINGFSSVSGAIGNYYNAAVQSTNPTDTEATTIAGMPSDILELGSKSLFSGIGISRQIATSTKAVQNADGSVAKVVHGNASLFKTGRNSALFSGLVSSVRNIYDFAQGKVSGSRAGGNVSADVVGGLGCGLLAAGSGSLAASMVSSGFGGGVIGLIAGSAAFIGADILYKNTGAYKFVSDKVTEIIDNILNRIHAPGGW